MQVRSKIARSWFWPAGLKFDMCRKVWVIPGLLTEILADFHTVPLLLQSQEHTPTSGHKHRFKSLADNKEAMSLGTLEKVKVCTCYTHTLRSCTTGAVSDCSSYVGGMLTKKSVCFIWAVLVSLHSLFVCLAVLIRACCVLHLTADTSAGRLNSFCWTCSL